MIGVPRILDNFWKTTNATDTMGVEETTEIVMEEEVKEVTEGVKTVMEEPAEVATEKAAEAVVAPTSAQELFGLHRPAAPFKFSKHDSEGRIFNAQAAQLPYHGHT